MLLHCCIDNVHSSMHDTWLHFAWTSWMLIYYFNILFFPPWVNMYRNYWNRILRETNKDIQIDFSLNMETTNVSNRPRNWTSAYWVFYHGYCKDLINVTSITLRMGAFFYHHMLSCQISMSSCEILIICWFVKSLCWLVTYWFVRN